MVLSGSELISLNADGDESSGERAWAANTAYLGLSLFLATVTMLFAGFTSAILVRRTASDWQPIPTPGLLWLNTALLLSSSLTMERMRVLARQERWKAMRRWLLATALLGLLFLTGQIGAWQQLAARGLYLSSNPRSSFFYILTGTHGVHLLGGLFALAYLLLRFLPGSPAPPRTTALNLCAVYWHFLDGLWIYLFVVLFVM